MITISMDSYAHDVLGGMKLSIYHSVVRYNIFKLSRRLQCPPLEVRTTLILLKVTDQDDICASSQRPP